MKGNFSKVLYSPDKQWKMPIWFFLRITVYNKHYPSSVSTYLVYLFLSSKTGGGTVSCRAGFCLVMVGIANDEHCMEDFFATNANGNSNPSLPQQRWQEIY